MFLGLADSDNVNGSFVSLSAREVLFQANFPYASTCLVRNEQKLGPQVLGFCCLKFPTA